MAYDNAVSKFGTEQDSNISVEVTGATVEFCFRVRLGAVKVDMHAKSLVDLIHKATIALLQWHTENAMQAINDLLHKPK